MKITGDYERFQLWNKFEEKRIDFVRMAYNVLAESTTIENIIQSWTAKSQYQEK